MSTPKTVAIIEARMASSRLPGKVLLPLAGAPALLRMVERVRQSETVDDVIVATTTAPGDGEITALCVEARIPVYAGSNDDVLLRVLETARVMRADVIVELTGDCPLIDPRHIDAMVALYRTGRFDYVGNRLHAGYPDGLDVRVFSTSDLADVEKRTADPIDRTHVSCYFYNHPELYRLGAPPLSADDEAYWPDLAITLDEPGDYELIARIFTALHPENPRFSALDVIRLLRENPEWLSLNYHVRRKALHEG